MALMSTHGDDFVDWQKILTTYLVCMVVGIETSINARVMYFENEVEALCCTAECVSTSQVQIGRK